MKNQGNLDSDELQKHDMEWFKVEDKPPAGVSDNYLAYRPGATGSKVCSLWYDPQHNGWSGRLKVTLWTYLPKDIKSWSKVKDKLPTGVSDDYLAYRPGATGSKVCSLRYDTDKKKWSGQFKVTRWRHLPKPLLKVEKKVSYAKQ